MLAGDLPNELRMLANRIEAADLAGDTCGIELTVHNIESREELAKWARFAGIDKAEVSTGEHGSWLRTYAWRQPDAIGVCVHFKSGLLGGKVKQVIEDDKEGLRALVRESAAVPQEAANA